MTPRQQSILIGAVVTGVLSTSYLSFINVLCCLGVIIGGIVAAQQYTSRMRAANERPVLESGSGAVLGALAGAGGAVIGPLLDRALRPLGLDSQTISRGMMEQWMEGMQGQQGMSPEMMQQFQGEQTFLMMVGGILLNLVLYSIFGAVGGAIGAAIFGEDDAGGGEGVQTAEAEVIE